MPFYGGERADVIGVFESSYQFQGFFAQGFDKFYGVDFTHYVFAADDLFLNPWLNERNILYELGLDAQSGYIKGLRALTNTPVTWFHHRGVYAPFYSGGTEYQTELPPSEVVYEQFNQLAYGK